MEATLNKQAIRGGEFLIRDTEAREVFIPEQFSEEQRMMAQACRDFQETEIDPNMARIDGLEEGLMESLLSKAGEMGLLGVTVPEAYGGLGMNFNTSMLLADALGFTGSFSTAFGAHTGIGTLPIQYYGSEEQKSKYLPKLASGEWKSCYCLTEPDAGSDANSGKTKAVLNAAGTHYLITGQKMWISNGGFAELMIVFAKIEDDKNLSAFIVERSFGGVTMNEEEKKMGIKGSSTRQIFFNETPVPVENMLSTRGNGFKIAVNILNIGRVKLGAACIGAGKGVAGLAIRYSNERKQFGVTIGSFGAIREKLANMAAMIYATESASYRVGQDIEDRIAHLEADGLSKQEATLKGVEEFAIEAAIMKVHGSEVLDYCVDEGVQVYGGMGFSAEAPMERHFRDSRITRIYEGTNEINRMLLVGMILKRAMAGALPVFDAAKAVGEELMRMPSFGDSGQGGLFAAEKEAVKNLKKAVLMVLGKAAQDLGAKLQDEQEILMRVADMMIEVYAAESALLRSEKLVQLHGEAACAQHIAMTQLYLYMAVEKAGAAAREAILCFAEGDAQRVLLTGLRRFTAPLMLNPKQLRHAIAQQLLEAGAITF